jgi:hypothetical protein
MANIAPLLCPKTLIFTLQELQNRVLYHKKGGIKKKPAQKLPAFY